MIAGLSTVVRILLKRRLNGEDGAIVPLQLKWKVGKYAVIEPSVYA